MKQELNYIVTAIGNIGQEESKIYLTQSITDSNITGWTGVEMNVAVYPFYALQALPFSANIDDIINAIEGQNFTVENKELPAQDPSSPRYVQWYTEDSNTKFFGIPPAKVDPNEIENFIKGLISKQN